MTIQEFYQRVKEELKQYLPEQYRDATVHIQAVPLGEERRYGVAMLSGRKERIPLLDLQCYLDDVNDGKSIESVLKEMAADYHGLCEMPGNRSRVYGMNKEDVMGHLHICVMNFEKGREILAHMPYLKVNDLAVVPMLSLPGGESVPISLHMAKLMEIPEDWLVAGALKNHAAVLPPTLQALSDVSQGGENYIDFDSQESINQEELYVLANKRKEFGAALIADKSYLDKLGKKLGGSFYILPTSMHSILIVPKARNINPAVLKSLVMEDVKKIFDEKEFLSDNIYLYNADAKTVEMFDGRYHAEKVQSRASQEER